MFGKGLAGVLCVCASGALAGGVAPGFEGVAAVAGGQPAEVLALPAVAKAVRAVVGPDWPVYQAMLRNPGKGGMQGGDYYGSACPDAECAEGYGTLFVDTQAGKVWVAWTDAGRLTFRPDDGSSSSGWPEKALEAYEFWPEM